MVLQNVRRWATGAALCAALGLPMGAWAQELVDVVKAAAAAKDPSEKAFYQDLADMHRKLAGASGLTLRLFVSDEEDVNAYATEQKGERWVVLNWGLLEALQHDRDAIAAVLAHEYAHHGKEHISKTKSTEGVLGVLGAIAGAAINYKLGTSQLGHTVGRTGAKVLSSSFSRDQEREADTQGLEWAIAAGYNPMGAVRLQKKLLELAGNDDSFSLFRTHPPSKDRAAELEALIAKNDLAKPLLGQPLVALNLPQDSEEEEKETTSAPNAAGRMALAAPSAASLVPIQGFSLERYAAYVNELAAAPDNQHAKVYAKFKLTEASAGKLTEAWVKRMQEDSALAVQYGIVYLETAIGPFANHAKAAAEAQRTGKAVAGEAPIPQSDWIELSKSQTAAFTNNKDYKVAAEEFGKATRAKGYSPYDFHLASTWWFTLARQKASAGDTSLLQKLHGNG
ncbi:M48 family metalloprotease [Rhodoferax sp. AJA081-3]|uniref:M48 family metalloprotease n=1 Tax=Rhodoferax sp. AJA081-3 TaxID=2752316 RepID=UPI001ADF0F63|nr:M48 family metalloprotease [Rhodoferax sp. AJA081-3]QTN27813.1 M48 family metalloprotease [Rhodoferax sp. AJA081-3]